LTSAPRRLATAVYDKVWGTPDTEPWYRNPERRDVGEIWFAASEEVPLLVKLLFTSDNLSVQVHPADTYARLHHNCRGKTEMWHILRAEPGAKIALGLREKAAPERVREAAVSGEIMDMLNWIPARAGDTFFVPAGTIHAIGGGLALCEVQQHSDVTYRLYDYGRGRDLHLDHSMAVSNLEAFGSKTDVGLPVECPYFQTDVITVSGSAAAQAKERNTLYIALEGSGTFAGEPFAAGEAWELEAGSGPFEIVSERARFLVTAPL
jgi:mannose-6-phosphate isomerase